MPPEKEEEVRDGPAGRYDQVGCPAYPHCESEGRQHQAQGAQARPGNLFILHVRAVPCKILIL